MTNDVKSAVSEETKKPNKAARNVNNETGEVVERVFETCYWNFQKIKGNSENYIRMIYKIKNAENKVLTISQQLTKEQEEFVNMVSNNVLGLIREKESKLLPVNTQFLRGVNADGNSYYGCYINLSGKIPLLVKFSYLQAMMINMVYATDKAFIVNWQMPSTDDALVLTAI